MHRLILCVAALLAIQPISTCLGADQTYEGSWHTTNRKLDGVMTCVVSEIGAEKWQGRFYGVWQGVSFDYTVAFSGSPSDLRGTAQIDGADYTWKGRITNGDPDSFDGNFGGSRYSGHFELKEKRPKPSKK